MTRFVLASANPDKAEEIASILAGLGVEVLPRPDDVAEVTEDGETLEANARLKAEALCRATGLPAIADDTGLEVDALDGAPGVHSARFAGVRASYADNCVQLLDALEGLPWERRSARFTTVALARWPDGSERVARGAVEGHIADQPRGTDGFGYDPVFIPLHGDGRTFAEMSPGEKHARSHRGVAFRNLARALARLLDGPDLDVADVDEADVDGGDS